MQNQLGIGVIHQTVHRMVAFGEYEGDGSASTIKARDYKDATDLVAHTLTAKGYDASEDGSGRGTPLVPVAFDSKGTGVAVGSDGNTPTLRSMNSADGRPNGGGQLAVAYTIHGTDKTASVMTETDVAGALRTKPPGSLENSSTTAVLQRFAVRRLTPKECERLQGFPDDFTQVPRGNKPMPDGSRYRMIGNSMAVNVMRWVGHRIDLLNKARAA